MSETLLVTGAAGQLGQRVVETLLDLGAGPIIATTRDPTKLADLDCTRRHRPRCRLRRSVSACDSVRGADRLLLISTDAVYQPGQRLAQHRAAIAAAEEAGVKHIVYTSVPAPQPSAESPVEDDHFWTEQAIAASGMTWTFMRHALYQELLLYSLPQGIASGQMATATGDKGRHSVSREDCARADAAVLASSDRTNRIYEVTGPAAVPASEVLALVAEIAGKQIDHISISKDDLKSALTGAGLPPSVARMMARFDEATALGFHGTVTDVVRQLTGHEPRSVREFLLENRAALLG